MHVGLHVKFRYYFQIFITLEFSGYIFQLSSYTKFHENPSSVGRPVPCGQTDTTELIAASLESV